MKALLLSDGSVHALAGARMLADRLPRGDLEVHVLSVAVRMDPTSHRTFTARRELAAHARAEAREWLQATAAPLRSRNVRVKTHLRSGHPREVAVEWSQRGFDLVVVGAEGREPTPFFDVGGVTLSVLEHAPAPVLMVRAPAEDPESAPQRHPLRILVAVDDGLHSRRVLDLLPRYLGAAGLEAEVLAVADREAGGSLGWTEARELARTSAAVLTDEGIAAGPRVEAGPATEVIVEAAEGVELVVVGSRAVERVQERHLGSVALEVARSAPCSVLVLRQGHSGIQLGRGVQAPGRALPFEISWQGVRPSRRLERHIGRAVEALEPLAPDALRCDVEVEQCSPEDRLGNLYRIRLELARPGGPLHVARIPPAHTENETVTTAVEEAFREMRRRLLAIPSTAGTPG